MGRSEGCAVAPEGAGDRSRRAFTFLFLLGPEGALSLRPVLSAVGGRAHSCEPRVLRARPPPPPAAAEGEVGAGCCPRSPFAVSVKGLFPSWSLLAPCLPPRGDCTEEVGGYNGGVVWSPHRDQNFDGPGEIVWVLSAVCAAHCTTGGGTDGAGSAPSLAKDTSDLG